jgi:hypothetical protein
VLRLDGLQPEALEFRRIVATRPDLERIAAGLDVPISPSGPKQGLSAEVLYGGQALPAVQASQKSLQLQVRFPAPLQPGEEHEYGLHFRFPADVMLPYYVFRPERRCDLFDLRVRFDPAHPPARVRQVNGEIQAIFEDAAPPFDQLVPDRAGEIHLQFHHLREHRNYGAKWAPGLPAV